MTEPVSYWKPGTVVEWVYRGNRLHPEMPNVRPVTVVRDDGRGLVAWLAPGTPVIKPVLADDGREVRYAGPRDMFTKPRVLKLDVWHGTGILKIQPAGKPWSVWLFWRGDGKFRGWYVNLEAIHERNGRRTETTDHVLDIWVTPDRRVEWKDEDELEGAVYTGRFTPAEAEQIIADARDAERDILAWTEPFNEGWERWKPDPAWSLPKAPTGYDVSYVAEELR